MYTKSSEIQWKIVLMSSPIQSKETTISQLYVHVFLVDNENEVKGYRKLK